jgi:hypothetical protein
LSFTQTLLEESAKRMLAFKKIEAFSYTDIEIESSPGITERVFNTSSNY